MALSVRQQRAVEALVALPEPPWEQHHHDTHQAAVGVLSEGLRSQRKRAATSRRPKGNPIPAASRVAVERRSGGWCEAATEACPEGRHRADHMHHVAGRRDHSPESLLHVCHLAHQWIHAHPALSRAAGWMRSRLAVES